MAAAWVSAQRAARALSVETPMANLYLALLDRMGVKTEHLGDANLVWCPAQELRLPSVDTNVDAARRSAPQECVRHERGA
jgi:hypothetical protein